MFHLLTDDGSDGAATEAARAFWRLYNRALEARRHVLAYGPPGTGKTHSAISHGLTGAGVFRHQCNPGDTAFDVLGRIGIADGSTVFQPGPGALAVETGARIVFDEIDRASDEIVSLLYGLADGKPIALADGSVLTPHRDLQVVLTTNANPWELWAPDSGVRDRFPFIPLSEPNPAALATLPVSMRAAARRAVRHGVTGLRAWQHFSDMLRDHGMTDVDALSGIDRGTGTVATDGNGLVLPSVTEREHALETISSVVFGPDGREVVRAWRVAACSDPTVGAIPAPRMSAADFIYATAFSAGRATAETHSHDEDDCADCAYLYGRGADAGSEAALDDHCCEHEHDSECSECDYIARNYHGHGTDECSECEEVWQSGYDCGSDHSDTCDCYHCERHATENREDGASAMLRTVQYALVLAGILTEADAEAFSAMARAAYEDGAE